MDNRMDGFGLFWEIEAFGSAWRWDPLVSRNIMTLNADIYLLIYSSPMQRDDDYFNI